MCRAVRNELLIMGPRPTLADVRRMLAGAESVIAFEPLSPAPNGLSLSERRRWRLEHWGPPTATTSDAQLIEDGAELGTLSYTFNTEHRAPVAFVHHLSSRYPQLTVTLIYKRLWRRGAGCGCHWSAGKLTTVIDYPALDARARRCGERRRGGLVSRVRRDRPTRRCARSRHRAQRRRWRPRVPRTRAAALSLGGGRSHAGGR
jgi:hypothetical protein